MFPTGSNPTEDECDSKLLLDSYPPPRGGVNVNWWIRNGRETRYHQLFDSDTSSDDGEDLDYLPSYTTRTQAQHTLNEQPGRDISSESIEAFCRGIRVSTVLALTLHEDYDGLGKKMARIFYDELQREPNASRLPTLAVSYGQTIRNAQAFIPRDLSAALRCLKELAKQRELGTVIAVMPDEKTQTRQQAGYASPKGWWQISPAVC